MRTLHLSLAALACGAALPQLALAADNTATGNNTLSPIVVTASRVPQTADDSLSAVTVITRQDIERSGALSVPELLQGRAGIETVSNGGYGQLTSLFLRGANSNAVLVLVDGVRVGSVSSGGVSWEFLPLSQIQRIEIVRGPHSVQYGADAVGGVIQIFTTGHHKQATSVDFNAGAGTYNTQQTGVGVSGGNGRSWYRLHAEHQATDGFDAYKLADPDSDGYDNTSYSASVGQRFGQHTEWQASAMQASGNVQYDRIFGPFGPNQDDYTQQVLSSHLGFRPLAKWHVTLLAGRSQDKRNSLNPDGSLAYRFDSTRKTYSWQNDVYLTDSQVLTAGLDRYIDELDSTTVYDQNRRTTRGSFVQYQGHYGSQSVLLGVRRTHDSQFGDKNTQDLAWAYRFTNGIKLRLSTGTAFRAPTFNDLYYPGFSNPNLRPETSRTNELGLSGRQDGFDWQLSAYRTTADDLIVFDGATLKPQNIDKATIDGFEAVLGARIAGFDNHLALTLLNPRDDISDKLLPRRAKQSLRWDLSRQLGKTTLGATLIAQSWRYDDAANTTRVPGYGVVNLRAEYRLGQGYTAYGRLDNVFDKDYEVVKNYNTAGRTLFVGIRYQGL